MRTFVGNICRIDHEHVYCMTIEGEVEIPKTYLPKKVEIDGSVKFLARKEEDHWECVKVLWYQPKPEMGSCKKSFGKIFFGKWLYFLAKTCLPMPRRQAGAKIKKDAKTAGSFSTCL